MRTLLNLLVLALFPPLPPLSAMASDALDGRPVIDSLDVRSLLPGRHEFYFRASSYGTGLPAFLPVVAIVGDTKGPRLLLVAGVHGDELNGIGVIHQLFDSLDPRVLSGAVIAIPGLNQTGIAAGARAFITGDKANAMTDLNRLAPGRVSGDGAANLYLGSVWHKIMHPNADLVIDLHTQTSGAHYPLFVFADFAYEGMQERAFTLLPDMIKIDAGLKGTLETEFNRQGIPALTLEIGAPNRFQPELIGRATNGILNYMRYHKMLAGAIQKAEKQPVTGRHFANVVARHGGYARIHVNLKARVKKGDKLASLYDSFGQLTDTYTATVDGHVVSIATNPVREPGSMLVRILY